MLFSNKSKPAVFIHIPKTGGNTIQKHLFDAGVSLDKMTLFGHQEGQDRFEVRGKYTRKKHMQLSEYYRHKKIRGLEIFTCIRHPLDRLVSFYFSPHRHIRLEEETQSWVMPSEVKFDINEFKSLVQSNVSMIEMLSFNSQYGVQFIPSNLKIIRTESLNQDAKRHLNLDIQSARNVSPYKEIANIVKADTTVKSIIKNSKHQADVDFFYGKESE